MARSLDSVPVAAGRLPLLGHFLRFLRGPVRLFESLPALGRVVRVDLGTLRSYVVTDAAVVNEVLVEQGRFFEKGKLFEQIRPLLGDGLVTSTRELHRRQRRVIQQVFHRDRLAAYATAMRTEADAVARSWQPGQQLQVDQVMDELILTTFMRTLFAGTATPDTVKRVRRLLRTVELGTLIGLALPKPVLVVTGLNRWFNGVAGQLRAIVDDLVERHHAPDADYDDLLAVLLAARDPETGEGMNDVLVRDELISFMVAAVETTVSSMAWIFHELGRNPEIERKLHAEIDAELADRPITHDDVQRLPYTRAVISEVLRLYALPMLMRRAIAPAVVGGVDLPVGTEVLLSPAALHLEPEAFPEPHRFDPDRWMPDSDRQPPRGCFLAFGNGSRRCIGEGYAMAEMVIAVAGIARRWRLEPVPGRKVRVVAYATVYPSRLPMVAVPRVGTPTSRSTVSPDTRSTR